MSLRYEVPVRKETAQELFDFWEEIFGPEDPDIPIGVFLGDEVEYNRHVVFLERDGGDLIGTCGMMTPREIPRLAGIGEVATRLSYRGRGIANRLCSQALDEFVAQGGEAVFLGTENPDAARIYSRLGWRRIAGSTVWTNVTKGDSPEGYLVDYFRAASPVKIVLGDASLRVPMIPLLLSTHEWQVLDGNLPSPMISTRYAEQNSCMGLCRKYYYLVKRDGAEWFAAKTRDNRLVGIATARIDQGGVCNLDGFAHARFGNTYNTLIETAIEWGELQNATRFATRLSVEDEEKRAKAELLGFCKGEADGTFIVGDHEVGALKMTLD